MTYDDDFADLDRMLAALPLEEPPATLRGRIMARTVYRPAPLLRSWEVWVLGVFVALAVWLSWIVGTTPGFAERLTEGVTRVLAAGGLTSLNTVLWLAAGASAAWWIAQLNVPVPRRIRAR